MEIKAERMDPPGWSPWRAGLSGGVGQGFRPEVVVLPLVVGQRSLEVEVEPSADRRRDGGELDPVCRREEGRGRGSSSTDARG
jgi:hypothetical protein